MWDGVGWRLKWVMNKWLEILSVRVFTDTIVQRNIPRVFRPSAFTIKKKKLMSFTDADQFYI